MVALKVRPLRPLPAITPEKADNPIEVLEQARALARELRAEKSTHPWTSEECDLLARLCRVLDVPEDF